MVEPGEREEEAATVGTADIRERFA